MSELEEMVVEQDNALAVAAEKYKKSRSEITRMKKENEEQVNKLKQEIARSLCVFRVTFFLGGGGSRNLGRSDFRLTEIYIINILSDSLTNFSLVLFTLWEEDVGM